ncbi:MULTISPECIES: hypothetical protein [Viridibacillus]|uniref:Uncharacterized protein n=1 Tax=Viridibacillus arenosi FSL R5-213 TaxID=1227360 RepID=W4EK63_9BACL|nr:MULTISPECIES: hypothetical protein [Viridibacillus]ETT80629.1 hypothetical protein C176_21666 [Viridibacillus arenosi FSL R5-213]
MTKKINIWAFTFSIIFIFLFMLDNSWGPIASSILGINSLNLLLYFTLIIFFVRLIGFAGVEDWKGMARRRETPLLVVYLDGRKMERM